ncbi:methylmalonyl Co-A mutase-associated GTPase MeaB, partial [Halorubrum sp. E3]
ADMDGAERTLAELEEMVHRREGPTKGLDGGHHGFEVPDHPDDGDAADEGDEPAWTPEVRQTVANTGEGVTELIETFDAHATHLRESGAIESTERRRYAEEIRTLVRSDVGALATAEIERRGGIDELADSVRRRETDPYSLAAEIVEPIADCVEAAPEGVGSAAGNEGADPVDDET